MKLTVIIPVFNEIKTIEKIIERIKSTNLDLQIIVVDDFSTDGTREILKNDLDTKIDELICNDKNYGKGY